MPWRRLRILPLLLWQTAATCTGALSASLEQSGLPLSFAREVASNGTILPLSFNLEVDSLADGESASIPCRDLHWGLNGTATLNCTNSNLQVDTVACLRVACPWHRLSAAGGNLYSAPSNALGVDGQISGFAAKWTAPVLAWDGALYAAPQAAANVLRVAHSSAEGASAVELDPTLTETTPMFGSVVLGSDGFVYGIPYSASQVLRLDPNLASTDSAVQLFGDVGTSGFKWRHGVMSQEGSIYAVPASADTVLVIDTVAVNATQLAIGTTLASGSLRNYLYCVLSPQGDIFGIPAESPYVLWIRPSTEAVTVLGSFDTSWKWEHGLVGLDGQIYGIPAAATAILRIDPSVDPPTLDDTLGAGLMDSTEQKWVQGILGPDGRIFGVPYGAVQVLVIDPSSSSVSLVGPSWSGGLYKWQAGVLGLDQNIYIMPYDKDRVLRVIPGSSAGEEVVEEVSDGGSLAESSERKYIGAAITPSGALFAFPAGRPEVLMMLPDADLCLAGPQPQAWTCTLGRPCEVELTATPDWPSDLSQGSLWVSPLGSLCTSEQYLEVLGFSNPQQSPSSTGDGAIHSFGVGLAGNLSSQHTLCWASYSGSPDLIELGEFQLLGPNQEHQVNCSLGLACTVFLEGLSLDNSSWVLAVELNSSLSAVEHCTLYNDSAANFSGFENPTRYEGEQGPNASFLLGTALNGSVGTYRLCWTSTLQMVSGEDFFVSVGSLEMHGPFLGDNMTMDWSCWVDLQCTLEVQGVGLSSTNELRMGEGDCGNSTERTLVSVQGLSNPATSNDGASYVLGTATTAYPNRMVLCWHPSSTGAGIAYGTLMVYGPMNGGLEILCRLNQTCSVSLANDSIVGYIDDGFGLENRLQLVKDTTCPGTAASLWGNVTQPVLPEATPHGINGTLWTLFFDLLTPVAANATVADEVLGTYSLCLSLGTTSFFMRLGSVTVEDVLCAAPQGIVQALEPACLSSYNGQAASSLRHGEQCIARCDNESTQTLTSLDCIYGELQPPSFECVRSCMLAPTVYNGLSHDSCANLSHGAVCDLRCPVNTVASGYLLCSLGFFLHKALLPGEFLFGVPRCYESCDATAVCGDGYSLLPHGQSCSVVCPSGSTPDMAIVSCRDGSLDSPECLATCANGPDVQFATNADECVSAVSGTTCYIRCQGGYAKTGDPVCDRGTWTTHRCLAPCVPAAVANTTDGFSSCYGILADGIVPHGGTCTPACKTGFLPEVPGGFSELSCFDGSLTPSSFLCRAPCAEAPSVAFADQTLLAACAGTMHNQSCEWSCFGGRIKTGDLICNDGVFSNASCLQLCNSPPLVSDALPVSGCTARPNGAVCSIQCKDGFSSPPGLDTAVCVDGAWSEVRCDKECLAPPDIEDAVQPSCREGVAIFSGGSCTPSCLEGLEPNEELLQCFQGVLSPPVFSCGRECGEVGFIENAVTADLERCVGMQYQKVCPLSCASGFRPSADLLCGRLGWQQYLPSSAAEIPGLPSCERVTCSLPLPSISGSDEEAQASGLSCADAIAGEICSDVQCPPGSELLGHFMCSDLGIWRPVPATGSDEVKCAARLCPETSPSPDQGEPSTCMERAIGATCPLSCPLGFRSGNGYVCDSNAQWVPLPGEAPACFPAICGTAPSLSNAIAPEACEALPSGGTCEGSCLPPWLPLGQYRCEAGRFVEVPICLPPEMLPPANDDTTVVETVPAVTFGALLEPSSDLQTFYTLEAWAALCEGPLEVAVRTLVTQGAPATAPATVRIVGRRAEVASPSSRRMQSAAELKPAAWEVEFHLLVAPNPGSSGEQVITALEQLQPGQMSESVVQALPALARPQLLRLSAAAPQEVQLPAPAATALAQPDGLILTTTTTTTTQKNYYAPASSPDQQNKSDGETQPSETIEDSGMDVRVIVLIVLVPVACGLCIFARSRMRRYLASTHETTTATDKVDFEFVLKEERLSDDAAGDVALSQVKVHERMQSMRSHRDDLQNMMTEGVASAAAAEVRAELAANGEGQEDTYDLAKLGDQKQLPTVGIGLQTLQNPGSHRHQQAAADCMVDVRSLRQGTGEFMMRSNTNLTRRDKRSIFKKALSACCAEAWYSCIESFPRIPFLHRCCCCCRCRCCQRPATEGSVQRRSGSSADDFSEIESSERSVEEVVHRPRRASRVSLSSCDAAEAVADGISRGLSPEQVYAIRNFWNFQGSDELVADLEGKLPYHMALRGEKTDISLASRYYASQQGGNLVSEKVTEARLYGEEERSEVHTLKLRAPNRTRVKVRKRQSMLQAEPGPAGLEVAFGEIEQQIVEEGSEADEVSEQDQEEDLSQEGGDSSGSSEDSSTSSGEENKDSSPIAASAMETNLSSVHRLDVVEIQELDADDVRAAVERAKTSAHYHQHARRGRSTQKATEATDATEAMGDEQ